MTITIPIDYWYAYFIRFLRKMFNIPYEAPYFDYGNRIVYRANTREYQTHHHDVKYQSLKTDYYKFRCQDVIAFREAMNDKIFMEDLLHYAMFACWFKGFDGHTCNFLISDYGLLHLICHCQNHDHEKDKHFREIRKQLKVYCKLK